MDEIFTEAYYRQIKGLTLRFSCVCWGDTTCSCIESITWQLFSFTIVTREISVPLCLNNYVNCLKPDTAKRNISDALQGEKKTLSCLWGVANVVHLREKFCFWGNKWFSLLIQNERMSQMQNWDWTVTLFQRSILEERSSVELPLTS